MSDPGLWDDNKKAREITRKSKVVKDRIKSLKKLDELREEAEVMIELAEEDETNRELWSEVEDYINSLEEKIDKMELKFRLNGEYDDCNAILSIHPGAGGTESQDWADMLLRMYVRWAESHGYKVETLDYLPGDEAGIKRVTLLISGEYSYGYLKGEKGVHRLVRISPFDSSGRRHTSFASVNVIPEIDDDIEVDIDTGDLKIETYRASGAGGQHVNKTDSAVRITHIPTGIVVQCQNERSQHKNKKMAMMILKARLLELKKEARAEKIEELRGENKEIAWGNQIRSYVFHPYNLIKDHRTGLEEGNVQKVMDGYIDEFIEAYLKTGNKGRE
ncbi:bacterial peptide chain release factor 2 (bRF-2) [Halothermothrix orenii H 168]|uniref:Peptide chain release factor 2 n=2 Tax=Halothermothrix orenii TaxID=31909 RepID=B8CYM3_HALOH|nr:bacterial peptide chain release factor 2 (bRF-2) [Halothermothrix orenii H 168]